MRPRLSLIAVFIVLGGGLLLAVWMLADARQAAWNHAADVSSNLAQALSLDVEHGIETYDLALQAAADRLHLPGLDETPPETRRAVQANGRCAPRTTAACWSAPTPR